METLALEQVKWFQKQCFNLKKSTHIEHLGLIVEQARLRKPIKCIAMLISEIVCRFIGHQVDAVGSLVQPFKRLQTLQSQGIEKRKSIKM